MYIYCPTYYKSNLAISRAILAPVRVVDRIEKYGRKYAEVVHSVTGKYLGLVPSVDLVNIGSSANIVEKIRFALTHAKYPPNKIIDEIVFRLKSVKQSIKLSCADMRAATPRNTADNIAENPRPISKPTIPRIWNKTRQKFRQITGGISEFLSLRKMRDLLGPPKMGKRQVKQNAKKIKLIGDDIFEANIMVRSRLVADFAKKINENAAGFDSLGLFSVISQ